MPAQGGPPDNNPWLAPRPAPLPAKPTPLVTGRNRHMVTLGTALGMLGLGGGAYAMDPTSAAGGEVLMVAPIVTLGAQAVMALIGYLRDYGKEKLDGERQRTLEAIARAEKAEQRAAELEAEIKRRDAREDEAREAENKRLREQVEALMQARAEPRKTPEPHA
jgi:hypothetical protein